MAVQHCFCAAMQSAIHDTLLYAHTYAMIFSVSRRRETFVNKVTLMGRRRRVADRLQPSATTLQQLPLGTPHMVQAEPVHKEHNKSSMQLI